MDEYITNSINNLSIHVPISEEAVEYPNKHSEVAHKLSVIAEFVEDKILKNFIENCSTKILKGSKLDENSLANIKTLISKSNTGIVTKETTEMLEFINFTRKLNDIVQN